MVRRVLERQLAGQSLELDNSIGLSAAIGVDMYLGSRWFVNIDARFRRSLSAGRRGYRGNELDGYRIETMPALINAMKNV